MLTLAGAPSPQLNHMIYDTLALFTPIFDGWGYVSVLILNRRRDAILYIFYLVIKLYHKRVV